MRRISFSMTERRLRILVVEDHPDTKDALVALLESLAYWVESCGDTATALARMQHYDNFDVLLTDVRLPGGDAWQLLAELSERGKLPPRVVTMSAFDAPEMRRLSEASGCVGHLVKPFGPDELAVMLG